MPKPYLNKEKIDEVVRKASRMVPLPHNAYFGFSMPRGLLYIDHILNTYNMSEKNRERLALMNNRYFHGLKDAYTNKSEENRMFLHSIPHWTQGPYQDVQKARRRRFQTNNNVPNNNARNVNYALAKYFRETDVRVPYKPDRFKNVRYLYRKVDSKHIKGWNAMLSSGIFRDKGIMSFSRDKDFVENWIPENLPGNVWNPVIFRLDVKDIPRGVPWLWFSANYNTNSNYTRNNSNSNNNFRINHATLPSRGLYVSLINNQYYSQSEVVLPPGYLILKNKKPNVVNGRTQVYDVTYMPDITAKSVWMGAPMHMNFTFQHLVPEHNRITKLYTSSVPPSSGNTSSSSKGSISTSSKRSRSTNSRRSRSSKRSRSVYLRNDTQNTAISKRTTYR